MLSQIRDSLLPDNRTCIVAYSGGKDSWAILNLAHQIFGQGNIHVYNLYLIPDLECELREIRKAESRYNLTVHRLPHPGVHDALRSGHLQPLPTPFRRKLHHADIYEYIRNLTGSDWIVFGHRIDESLQRRGMIKPFRGVLQKHRKCYPLWNWKAADVFHYLQSSNIPAPEQYTEDDTTGLTLNANTLLYLREKYPADYAKIIQLFPLAEVQFYREMQRIESGLPPTHYSLTRKKGLMETLNEYIEKSAIASNPTANANERRNSE